MRWMIAGLACMLTAGWSISQDMPLSQILKDGQTWKPVQHDFPAIGGLTWEPGQNKLLVFDISGVCVGSISDDLKADSRKADVVYRRNSVRGHTGDIFELQAGKLLRKSLGKGDDKVLSLPLKEPSALGIWDDATTLIIADAADRWMWAFRIENDGSLGPGDRYYSLYAPRAPTKDGKQPHPNEPVRTDVSVISKDNQARVYAASKFGVQVFDPTGRLCGTLLKPSKSPITAMSFGGKNGDLLFVAHGKELFVRQMLAKASWIPAPPTPPKKK